MGPPTQSPYLFRSRNLTAKSTSEYLVATPMRAVTHSQNSVPGPVSYTHLDVYKRQVIREPYTRPVFPRMSSFTSGFFFWGMMEEPVE